VVMAVSPDPDDLDKPPRARRLAAVLIDVGVLLVVAPCVAVALGIGTTELLTARGTQDCASPCDGPPMAGASLAMIALMLVWLLYWPIAIFWRRRTIGSRMVGLRLAGRGLRRHFVRA